MLETVREYALERLEQSDSPHWRRRHAEYFMALAEAANSTLDGLTNLLGLIALKTSKATGGRRLRSRGTRDSFT
jgi:predicted ATPase